MPKTIKSPVEKWPGIITLCDPLSFPQVIAIEDAVLEAGALDEEASMSKYHGIVIDPICDCVEKWELEGIGNPPTPFPATPRREANQLMGWLIGEIMALFQGAGEIPEE